MSDDSIDYARRFGGLKRLYGAAALARFEAAHVCVVGIGGVGSWAVEALARSAIKGTDLETQLAALGEKFTGSSMLLPGRSFTG